jgi:creatinine amidohydrolase
VLTFTAPSTASSSKEEVMNHVLRTLASPILLFTVPVLLSGQVETNPLFHETKIKNYLPHMTWREVEEALTRTDMVIIPVGSIEQHGKHLPLCTDLCAAIEISKLIAEATDVLVAPAVFAGLSEHHMEFPGSLTLSPETFEAVVLETAQSLIRHGMKKILIYNGHGGNNVSVANVIQKINQTTKATAVDLSGVAPPPWRTIDETVEDGHAGIGETASMLYLTPGLVEMSKAEQPVLTRPPLLEKLQENMEAEPNLALVAQAMSSRPKSTGKRTSTSDVTSNGVTTTGDLASASAASGSKQAQRFVDAAVRFIEAWKRLSP